MRQVSSWKTPSSGDTILILCSQIQAATELTQGDHGIPADYVLDRPTGMTYCHTKEDIWLAQRLQFHWMSTRLIV